MIVKIHLLNRDPFHQLRLIFNNGRMRTVQMESLIECIAAEIGPKWIQLYSRLGLGARDRYKFQTDHHDDPEGTKEQNCARDTLTVRRRSLGEVEEREAMKRLLCALRKIKEFDRLAGELADKHGIILESPHPPVVPNATFLPPLSQVLPAPSRPVEVPVTHPCIGGISVPQSANIPPKSSSSQDHDDSPGSDTEPVHSELSYTAPSESPVDLSSPINLKDTKHKFALLDLCQRLRADKWNVFAMSLQLPHDLILQFEKEQQIEERYYKTLKCWVKRKQEGATFDALYNTLKTCSQENAIIVVKRRLRSLENTQ